MMQNTLQYLICTNSPPMSIKIRINESVADESAAIMVIDKQKKGNFGNKVCFKKNYFYLCKKLSLANSICSVPPFHFVLFKIDMPVKQGDRKQILSTL